MVKEKKKEEVDEEMELCDQFQNNLKLKDTGNEPNLTTPTTDIPPGLGQAYLDLSELLALPLDHADLFVKLKLECPKGVLLHGPPGVGKTYLVRSVCTKFRAHLVSISGPEIYSPYPGESERRLRESFEEARELSNPNSSSSTPTPCILFIDEIDALAPTRKNHSDSVENRVVAQLLTLMDGLTGKGTEESTRIFVIGATNRPNAIDPALRRPGRFDREVAIDVPSEETRKQILLYQTRQLHHQNTLDGVDFELLAKSTIGYVGADLNRLCSEAFLLAALEAKLSTTTLPFKLHQRHFNRALKKIAPSLQRHESVVSITHHGWDTIAGLDKVRKELTMAVEWPLKYPHHFERLGLRPPRGILLYGPPGCSKTSLVKVLASTSRLPMFTLHGASVYSCYVGESEATVRMTFERARRSAPSILFIDEIDTLVGRRSFDTGGQGTSDPVQERILTMLLNEMDGVQAGGQVLVVGATNRPDSLDAALLRPGRFDRQIYIPPPDPTDRSAILTLYCSKMPLAPDVNLTTLAQLTTSYSGADLRSLCNEACLLRLRSLHLGTAGSSPPATTTSPIEMSHFQRALQIVPGTLTPTILALYQPLNPTPTP